MDHDLDTAPVRPGEELPVAALEAYLAQHLPDAVKAVRRVPAGSQTPLLL